MGRIIAIDYGLRRVGVAWTDAEKRIALPVGTFAPQEIIAKILEWAETHPIEGIVVGYPLRLSGAPTHLTPHVEALIKTLQEKIPHIPIHRQDERLTSIEAEKHYQYAGISLPKRQRKQKLDMASAVLILQRYMDKS